jgi:hypothetical protein
VILVEHPGVGEAALPGALAGSHLPPSTRAEPGATSSVDGAHAGSLHVSERMTSPSPWVVTLPKGASDPT